MEKALIIFIKNPEKGQVKTRLANDIGDSKALCVYKHMLAHTRNISSQVAVNRLLFYADRIQLRDEWPEKEYGKFLQSGANLGDRMLSAFQSAFNKGHRRMIIIGSDCMELDKQLIERAFDDLENHDFVIGPAKDGGYYLLGMKYPERTVFKHKTWSSETVYKDTLADIQALSKTVSILPVLSDIDTVKDLNQELLRLIYPLS